jgi:transposase
LETIRAISAAELERMMKLQDVILKAMAKKITWLEAAEIIGVCDRTMRRMRERYQEFGYDGLFDQRRRKRTTLRVPMATAERVLTLYQETYFDLSVRHFHEKLREEHAIELSYIVQRRVRTLLVVIDSPAGDLATCVPEVPEPTRVQTFITESPMKAFDMPVLCGLSRLNVTGTDASLYTPGQIVPTAHLGAVIGAQLAVLRNRM